MPVIDLDAQFKELRHDIKQAFGMGNKTDDAEVVKLKAEHATATAEVARLTTELATRTTQRDELQGKVDGFEKTEREKSANALSAAKESAKKLALTAKGQGTPEYDEEVALIDAQTNPAVLATFARGYEAEAKAGGVPNTNRTANGNNPATEPDDAVFAKVKAAKEAGEKANKPTGGN